MAVMALPNGIGSVVGKREATRGSGSMRKVSARFANAASLSADNVAATAFTTTKRRCAMPSRVSQASTSRWLASALAFSAAWITPRPFGRRGALRQGDDVDRRLGRRCRRDQDIDRRRRFRGQRPQRGIDLVAPIARRQRPRRQGQHGGDDRLFSTQIVHRGSVVHSVRGRTTR